MLFRSFSIYPNPASDKVSLMNNLGNYLNAKYEITDLNGRIVTEGKISDTGIETDIDVSGLPESFYFIRVVNCDGGTAQFRFVKITN